MKTSDPLSHGQSASLSPGGTVRGILRGTLRGEALPEPGATSEQFSHVHPSLDEAQKRGAEPAVLRFMGERLVNELLFNCAQNGIDPNNLNKKDLSTGIDDTLRGMVDSSRDQYASVNFEGFRDFYKSSRDGLKALGSLTAERQTLALIDMLQASQSSSLLSPAERRHTESLIVQESRVAASAYRSAGLTDRHVVAMFRDNTDVANSPVVGLIEKSIDEDAKISMVRRADSARNAVNTVNTVKEAILPNPHRAPSPYGGH